ncbi:MAG: YtxH domain-containing protein [Tissierellia bacterium]|nr:YtxH domain-containing protein [Tissierellia bacterium]
MLFSYFDEKRRAEERKRKMEKAGNVSAGLAIGALLGGISGILFAPKSGEETRKDISNKATEVGNNVKHKAHELKDQTVELQEKIKANVKTRMDSMKDKKKVIEEGAENIVDEVEEVAEDLKK